METANAATSKDDQIYKNFMEKMKAHAKADVRSIGEVTRSMINSSSSRQESPSVLTKATLTFVHLDSHLENIESNLHKVCSLTRQGSR